MTCKCHVLASTFLYTLSTLCIFECNDFESILINQNVSSTPRPDNQIKWKDILTDEKKVSEVLEKLRSTTPLPNNTEQSMRPKSFVEILIKEPANSLRSVSRRKVMKSMFILEKLELPLQKKLIIWEIFKGGRNVEDFGVDDLRLLGKLIMDIPEDDLFKINMMDRNITNYLGTIQFMQRRKAAILLYSLKMRTNHSTLRNSRCLNELKGLICGLSMTDLNYLDVYDITPSVFQNLWSCNNEQLLVVLNLCIQSLKYGPVENWLNSTVADLGLLITALEPQKIGLLDPTSTSGIQKDVLERLSTEQIMAFDKTQIKYLNLESVAYYKLKMFVNSAYAENNYNIYHIDLLLLVYFIIYCLI